MGNQNDSLWVVPPPEESTLDRFLRFADSVQAAHAAARRPAYAEACPCGGTVEVSRDVPAAERRRIRDAFLGRHNRCTGQPTTDGGQDLA